MPNVNKIIKKTEKKALTQEQLGWLAYDLLAGFSYGTGIPNLVSTAFSTVGASAAFLSLGLAAGGYFAHSDIKKINEDNAKIIKTLLFLMFYTSHLLENHGFFNHLKKAASPHLDDEKAPLTKKDTQLSAQDEINIEILQDIKDKGFSENKACQLSRKQSENLQHYLNTMKRQAEDNLPEFYQTIHDFQLYKESNRDESRELNSFWQQWKHSTFSKDPLIAEALIHNTTLDGACHYYGKMFNKENLRHLKEKYIISVLKKEDTHRNLIFFRTQAKKAITLLSTFPIAEDELLQMTSMIKHHFHGHENATLIKNIQLYTNRLEQLAATIIQLRKDLSPYYSKEGLTFLPDVHTWMEDKMTYLHYSAKNSTSDLLSKAFLWMVSTLGVYDATHRLLSDTDPACDHNASFDWVRLLVGVGATALGTNLWNKLEKAEKIRNNLSIRITKQFEVLAAMISLDNNFNTPVLPASPLIISATKNGLINYGTFASPKKPLAESKAANDNDEIVLTLTSPKNN